MIAARTELPVARATASWNFTSSAATSRQGTSRRSRVRATSPTMCSSSARAAGSARRAAQPAFSASKGSRNSASSRAVAERKRSRLPSAAGDEVGARLGDEGAAAGAGADLDHALGLERPQRLAQRRARDPEGDPEIALAGQPLARLDAAGGDGIADLADDVIERAHALRGDEAMWVVSVMA